jgi:hypothetical protein
MKAPMAITTLKLDTGNNVIAVPEAAKQGATIADRGDYTSAI